MKKLYLIAQFKLFNLLKTKHIISRHTYWQRTGILKSMVIKTALSTFLFLAFVFFSKGSELDSVNQQIQIAPLFASTEPLKLTLTIDIKTVKNDNSEDPQYSDGSLILHDDSEESKHFEIKVKARGHARRLFDICSFPPIKLNFKKKAVKGTIFEGQDKLKLVSYCKNLDINEHYVLQEYLIYKMYNCLTPYSFNVRLAEVTYKDLNDKSKEVTRYGFLIEDDERMAERNGGTITELLMSNQDRCDRKILDIFTIFQFMIGNVDWWMAKPVVHNVKLIYMEGKPVIPVPYDFDYCGSINAKYATPPEELPMASVRERYFRGYCRIPGTYENIVALFNEKQEEIYDVYRNFELLDEKTKNVILKYYDGFYKIVNDPKQLERKIYDHCELSHTHLHKVKKKK
jgi:hypothetical protein